MGLHNISVIWSPNIIVVGGPLVSESLISLDTTVEYLNKTLTVFEKSPEIVHAAWGDKVTLYGALAYAGNRALSI
jgi:hypothetical protein